MSNVEKEQVTPAVQTTEQGSDSGFTDCAVPLDKRERWPSMAYAWFGAAMFVGLYYAGVELGTSMGNLSNALLAIVCGAVFLALFISLNGIMGYKTGCTASLLGTYAYGSRGACIPGFHITDIGWNVMSTAQLAVIVNAFFPQIDTRVYCILFSMLFLTNSFVGFKPMVKLNKIAMPILLLTGLYGLLRLQIITPGGLPAVFQIEHPYTISIGTGITIVVGTWISGTSRAADYFRFAKSTKDTVIAAFMGFFCGMMICICVGAFWGAGTSTSSISETLVTLGGGMVVFGLIMFTLQTWTTDEHNGYTTGNALPLCSKALCGEERIHRRPTIAVMIAICIICCGFGVEKYFTPFLNILGIFLPVIGAITIADFYIMSHTRFHWSGHKNFYALDVNDEEVQHHKFNPAVIPTLIGGALVGWFVKFGISAVNSMAATVILYCLFTVLFAGSRKKEAAKNHIA